jgi:hypothetical protein
MEIGDAGGYLMKQAQSSAGQAKQQAHQAVRDASPWLEGFGRFGYVAKGVVYTLVGVLAAQAAIGMGGATTDARGALPQIIQAPFGQVLLAATAIGLVGYGLWRFIQAGMDTENKGTDVQGLLTRGTYVIIGVSYITLALSALQLLQGSGRDSSGGDSSAQDQTAWLLSQPFGQGLVGLVGAVVIGVGLYQWYQAYSAKFREQLKLGEMSSAQQRWATRLGRLGFAARGVVFGIVGVLLIAAAIHAEPQEARGLGGALTTLAEQSFGPWLLGIIAVGLMAYGVYVLVEARYRRMVLR